MHKTKNGVKFMLYLHDEQEEMMREQAKIRGITIQEQLRAVVIPEWIRFTKPAQEQGTR